MPRTIVDINRYCSTLVFFFTFLKKTSNIKTHENEGVGAGFIWYLQKADLNKIWQWQKPRMKYVYVHRNNLKMNTNEKKNRQGSDQIVRICNDNLFS